MFALYNRGRKIPVKKMEKNKLRLLVVEDEKKLCVGRLLMFKECLKYNIVPFMIEEDLKMFYYRGLKEWNNEKGYLCLLYTSPSPRD